MKLIIDKIPKTKEQCCMYRNGRCVIGDHCDLDFFRSCRWLKKPDDKKGGN